MALSSLCTRFSAVNSWLDVHFPFSKLRCALIHDNHLIDCQELVNETNDYYYYWVYLRRIANYANEINTKARPPMLTASSTSISLIAFQRSNLSIQRWKWDSVRRIHFVSLMLISYCRNWFSNRLFSSPGVYVAEEGDAPPSATGITLLHLQSVTGCHCLQRTADFRSSVDLLHRSGRNSTVFILPALF